MKSFNIYTLGCKVNHYESASISNLLLKNGFNEVKDRADLSIINTCSVTSTADSKSRQKISKVIKENPDSIIVVVGCYAKLDALNLAKNERIRIILGNNNKGKILDYLKEYENTKKQIIVLDDDTVSSDFVTYKDQERVYIKIVDGCDAFCSYCIIPYTRGMVKSRNANEIINEINELVRLNVSEIVLTGIHLGMYGKDLKDVTLSLLIKRILEETSIKRIRLSSLEIKEIDPLLITLLKTNPRLIKHLHLPLQSGSNRILKLMNRKYLKEEFISIVDNLKSEVENLVITTDIIVGYPTESLEDFNDTLEIVKLIKFAKVHAFKYSRRPGTVSATLKDIDSKIKNERITELIDLADSISLELRKNKINTIEYLLVESNINGHNIGYDDSYFKVMYQSDTNDCGKIVKIKIIFIQNDVLIAQKIV